MDFVALVDQVIALLRQRGRVTYRTLQRQFQLDADTLTDLLGELRYAHPEAIREDEQGIEWTDDALGEPAARAPLTYTPSYLAEKILTSRSTLEGERKQVTVLFADLKGSMELLADRDPEEARQLLDPVLEQMMAAVHRYEGTVNQVMGDGIMALFGAPIAHEDHAVRACYAALAMQAAMRSYTDEVRRARVLLLVNYRPEYQHGWGSKTYYTQLRLDPLPPASAEEFLQALLGDDPSPGTFSIQGGGGMLRASAGGPSESARKPRHPETSPRSPAQPAWTAQFAPRV